MAKSKKKTSPKNTTPYPNEDKTGIFNFNKPGDFVPIKLVDKLSRRISYKDIEAAIDSICEKFNNIEKETNTSMMMLAQDLAVFSIFANNNPFDSSKEAQEKMYWLRYGYLLGSYITKNSVYIMVSEESNEPKPKT